MSDGEAVIVRALSGVELDSSQPAIYDHAIGLKRLYTDPASGAEHYLVHYPAGTASQRHRHSVAQTIVVLQGTLVVNGTPLGPGSYCHFPAHSAMQHSPTEQEDCLFVTIFHGPFDLEPLD